MQNSKQKKGQLIQLSLFDSQDELSETQSVPKKLLDEVQKKEKEFLSQGFNIIQGGLGSFWYWKEGVSKTWKRYPREKH